jgi:lysozyme
MTRSLEIFPDGSLYEHEDGQPIKLTETHGKVNLLLEALQFTQAETFSIAPADAVLPEIPEPRAGGREINQTGLEIIKSFEGLFLEAYQDVVGVWTIGWGATEGIRPGMKITVAEAEALLKKELGKFEAAVADFVKVKINDDQFSALVCFSYNVGAHALLKSTLLQLLNQGKYQEAAEQFLRWDKAGSKSYLGLSRRRRAERSLFLSQAWEWARTWEPEKEKQVKIALAAPGESLVQGEQVRKVQQALVKAGFNIKADGVFGPGTDKAVKQFQQKNGLTADGVVGSKTLAKLGL